MEQSSLASVFTGWTIHAKACAGLPSSGGKFKVVATRRRGRSRAMRPYHACYRREKGKKKEWQEIMPTSVTFPSLLSHPFRGGRLSTEKMHNGALATWLQSSFDCCSPLLVSRVWLVPLSFPVNYELSQLNPTGTFVWSEPDCRLQCQVLALWKLPMGHQKQMLQIAWFSVCDAWLSSFQVLYHTLKEWCFCIWLSVSSNRKFWNSKFWQHASWREKLCHARQTP